MININRSVYWTHERMAKREREKRTTKEMRVYSHVACNRDFLSCVVVVVVVFWCFELPQSIPRRPFRQVRNENKIEISSLYYHFVI